LVIAGGQDRLVSLAATRQLADGIPHAHLEVIAHARHGLHLADDETLPLLRQFHGTADRQTLKHTALDD
jgi:pimeloyl-ACP methyl ester carboxylesterase